jgi:hypothetical protein
MNVLRKSCNIIQISLFHHILLGDKNEKNKMGGSFDEYGERGGSFRVLARDSEENRPLAKT